MSDGLSQLGISRQPKADFGKSLFYFIKELGINPLPEEYEAVPVYRDGKIVKYKIKKLAMPLNLFNKLLNEMNQHAEREKRELNKSKVR